MPSHLRSRVLNVLGGNRDASEEMSRSVVIAIAGYIPSALLAHAHSLLSVLMPSRKLARSLIVAVNFAVYVTLTDRRRR